MNKIRKKIIAVVMALAIAFESFAPFYVEALDTYETYVVQFANNYNIDGDKYVYDNGYLEITRKSGGNTSKVSGILYGDFSVSPGDEITFTLHPDNNYSAKLYVDTGLGDTEVTLTNNSYTFKIADEIDFIGNVGFTPEFNSIVTTYDFVLNGQTITGFGNGNTITVPNNFNMDSITEFYIKNIYQNGVLKYSYGDNEYSYDLLDSQNRHILETNITKVSNNYIKMRVQSHPSDIKTADRVQSIDQYPEFYIPEINIQKSAFRGVEVVTNAMPDSYDFTGYNGVDLADTDENNFGEVSVYYGEDSFKLINDDIASIELVPDMGVPEDAVSFNNMIYRVTVKSNYYNEIPLKVTLGDGTVGYILVKRIGLFIGNVNQGETVFPHGASADVGTNLDVDTEFDRIVAVFYHDDDVNGEDIKLIVNATYEDGREETMIADYVGSVDNSDGDIVGSDYILWRGNEDMPVKVSVTAVDAEVLNNDEEFSGAYFGSGAGVTWELDR